MIENTEYNKEVLKELVDKLVASSNPNNKEDLLTLRDSTINFILCYFDEYITPNNTPLDFISSDEVTVEVKDNTTNRIFRKTLNISYIENSNGIKMVGENLKGKPSEIVFLSDTGINKIIDVTGQGLNKSRCHD